MNRLLACLLLSVCVCFTLADIPSPGCPSLIPSNFEVDYLFPIWRKKSDLRVNGASVGTFIKPCPTRLDDAELYDSGDNFIAKADNEAFSWAKNIRLLDCNRNKFASITEASDKVLINKISIDTEYQVLDGQGNLIGVSQKTGVFDQQFTIVSYPDGVLLSKATRSMWSLNWDVQALNRTYPAGDPRIIAFVVNARMFASHSGNDSCTKFVWYGAPILGLFVLVLLAACVRTCRDPLARAKCLACCAKRFPCCRCCCPSAALLEEEPDTSYGSLPQ